MDHVPRNTFKARVIFEHYELQVNANPVDKPIQKNNHLCGLIKVSVIRYDEDDPSRDFLPIRNLLIRPLTFQPNLNVRTSRCTNKGYHQFIIQLASQSRFDLRS